LTRPQSAKRVRVCQECLAPASKLTHLVQNTAIPISFFSILDLLLEFVKPFIESPCQALEEHFVVDPGADAVVGFLSWRVIGNVAVVESTEIDLTHFDIRLEGSEQAEGGEWGTMKVSLLAIRVFVFGRGLNIFRRHFKVFGSHVNSFGGHGAD
jgi:hypothetical protein